MMLSYVDGQRGAERTDLAAQILMQIAFRATINIATFLAIS